MNKIQQHVFTRLVELRVPEDWAGLVAQRVERSRALAPEVKASGILISSFDWARTPGGYDFWKGVYLAFVYEEEWFEKNGDLTPEQVALIDAMMKEGLPQEWAILIAMRVREGRWTRYHDQWLYMLKTKSVTREALLHGFDWYNTSEGYDFWYSVHSAAQAEMKW